MHMYNHIYIYHLGIHTCIYIHNAYAYIHMHSIHAHMYAYLYMHTHCMDATTPHAVPSPTNHQTHTLHYILSHAFHITTHTHTVNTCTSMQYQTSCILGHHRASTKAGRLCACPASTPFEHACPNRCDCRLTDPAPPQYHCPASTLA